MSYLHAIILGIIQGLTEFLPVSSSGHLVIVQSFFKNFKQSGISFDVILHFGTLFSVLIYFRKEIIEILKLKNKKWLFLIVIATIPAGIVGIFFKDFIENLFNNVKLVSFSLIVTGIILFFSDKFGSEIKDDEKITFLDAIIIGIAQAFAIIPGISRSGSTIATGIFCGLKRDVAIKFSFIMSIPAILGAVVLSLKDFSNININYYPVYLAGFLSSLIFGLLALKILTILTKIKNLKYFSFYCWIVAIGVLIWTM